MLIIMLHPQTGLDPKVDFSQSGEVTLVKDSVI